MGFDRAEGERHDQMRRRFDDADAYFTALSRAWGEGTRRVFHQLPAPDR
jgi:predicted proteasome-type protease